MTLQVSRIFKSIDRDAFVGVEFSDFSILTGPNGAGKSNLLEGLQTKALYFDDLGEIPEQKIRLFRLGELLAAVEGPMQGQQFKEPWANLYNNVLQWRDQARSNPGVGANDEERERWIANNATQNKLASGVAIDRMKKESGKTLLTMDEVDFRRYAPMVAGVKDPFVASIAEIFLSYTQRFAANEQAQWRHDKKGVGTPLSDEEFVSRFGPAPWKALNDLLRLIGLDYTFNEPSDSETTLYEVGITHASGVPLKLADLSSGEKVLLVVALSLYAGTDLREAIELPRLLLLDEADASLHPSMVKSLLTVLQEVFVKQHGVRVVLTTHSPTTVALAPPGSLYVMDRKAPRLRKATTDEAMKLLTVGMTTLSVKLENRRQVFVESDYDQAVYQALFGLLQGRLESVRTAEFIAASVGNAGGGCEEVKRLVRQLHASGNDMVRGIVDRDTKGGTPDHVLFLADRYAIENLVFDPLILSVFLLRNRFVTAGDLGLPSGVRHFELREEHAANIERALSGKLGFGASSVQVKYAGGFQMSVAEEYLEMRGHDLQGVVVTTFPQLERYKKDVMRSIISEAVLDVPHFAPASVLDLFDQVLAD